MDPLSASWFRLLVGATALVGAAVVGGRARAWFRDLSAKGALLDIAKASFFGTVLGLFLSQVALAKSSSGGVASTLLATSPIFALPLAHVLGMERATARSALGIVVAFAGVALLVSR